jgi:hypothetical protein
MHFFCLRQSGGLFAGEFCFVGAYGNLEKSLSLPIADSLGVNVNESERERNGIIRGQFCGVRRAGPIFRGAVKLRKTHPYSAKLSWAIVQKVEAASATVGLASMGATCILDSPSPRSPMTVVSRQCSGCLGVQGRAFFPLLNAPWYRRWSVVERKNSATFGMRTAARPEKIAQIQLHSSSDEPRAAAAIAHA